MRERERESCRNPKREKVPFAAIDLQKTLDGRERDLKRWWWWRMTTLLG